MKIKLLDDQNVKFGFMKAIKTDEDGDCSFELINKIMLAKENSKDEYHDVVFTVNGIELDFSLVMKWLLENYDKYLIIQAEELIKEKYRPVSLPDIDEVFTSIYNKFIEAKEAIEYIQEDIDKALSIDIVKQLSK